MIVLALDLSLTSTGYASVWNGALQYGTVSSSSTGVERLGDLEDKVLNEVTFAGPDLVAIEGYSFGSKGRAVFNIGELGGVVRLALYRAGIEFVEVAPSTIKKYATGKGNAGKDAVRDQARDRFGLDVGISSDVCDAIWLLAVTYEALGNPLVSVPKVNRSAAQAIDLHATAPVATGGHGAV